MQDLTALEGKTIVELREIAKVLGITPSNMKKGELINKIVQQRILSAKLLLL